jgi:hypothetical protein
MGCAASSIAQNVELPLEKGKAKSTTTDSSVGSLPSGPKSVDGNTMDSLETGTKMYMSLYPERSTDGGKNTPPSL